MTQLSSRSSSTPFNTSTCASRAYGKQGDDDAWRLDSVIVLLYDDETVPLTSSRLFSLFAPKGMWFGNEHGHQAWLSETRNPFPGVRAFLNRLDPKAYPANKGPVGQKQKKSSGKKR